MNATIRSEQRVTRYVRMASWSVVAVIATVFVVRLAHTANLKRASLERSRQLMRNSNTLNPRDQVERLAGDLPSRLRRISVMARQVVGNPHLKSVESWGMPFLRECHIVETEGIELNTVACNVTFKPDRVIGVRMGHQAFTIASAMLETVHGDRTNLLLSEARQAEGVAATLDKLLRHMSAYDRSQPGGHR